LALAGAYGAALKRRSQGKLEKKVDSEN